MDNKRGIHYLPTKNARRIGFISYEQLVTSMNAVEAVVGILIAAIVGLVAIAVIDTLPAAEGALAPTSKQLKISVVDSIALAVGGTVTIVFLLITRLRSF